MSRGVALAYGRVPVARGKQTMASADERPRSYGAGRVCAAQDRETVLSSYNPSTVCCLHSQGWAGQSVRVRRPRGADEPSESAVTCANPLCGVEFKTSNPVRKFCSDHCRMKAFRRRTAAERSAAATTRPGPSA